MTDPIRLSLGRRLLLASAAGAGLMRPEAANAEEPKAQRDRITS